MEGSLELKDVVRIVTIANIDFLDADFPGAMSQNAVSRKCDVGTVPTMKSFDLEPC